MVLAVLAAIATQSFGTEREARAQEPTLEKIIGHLSDAESRAPLQGAYVQACPSGGGTCLIAQTDLLGSYEIDGLGAGIWEFRLSPPANSTSVTLRFSEFLVGEGIRDKGDISFPRAKPFTAGTTVTPSRTVGVGGVPIIYWDDRLTFTTLGCAGGSASVEVNSYPDEVSLAPGSLDEVSPGTYRAIIEPLRVAVLARTLPLFGYASINFSILCPDGARLRGFPTIFIDPSSHVRTTSGQPIGGATVELSRAEGPAGPFVTVPTGSAIISPATRSNPQVTGQAGLFGWDVIAGFYRIRAAAPGCVDPADPTRPFIETPVFDVPPQIIDLDLRLACDTIPPTTLVTLTPAANASGWNKSPVAVNLAATDNTGGSGVRDITYSASGAQASAAITVTASTASLAIGAEGSTTVSYSARDNAGNAELPRTATVQIDRTAPTVTTGRTPAPNANGWNNTDVVVRFAAHDDLSGFGQSLHDATTTTTLTTEGANQSVTTDFSDLAGNSTEATVSGISIDRVAPTTTAIANPAANPRGWNRTPVLVTLAATDMLSGLAQTEFSLDGAPFAPYSGGISISTDGVHTLRYRSTDRAGNSETTGVLVVRIDRTPPEATIRFDPLTLDFAVIPRDDVSGPSGAATGAPGSDALAMAIGRSGAASDSDDERSVRIYRLDDRAGNTIELVVRLKHEDHELEASLVSLRLNGGPPQTLPANELRFEWAVSRGVLKELEQKISIGKGQKQRVEAHFQAKKNETRIEQEDRKGERELTRPGLVLLRLETDRGALAIRFD